MSTAEPTSDPALRWDLGDLYPGPQAPAISYDWDRSLEKAKAFQDRFKEEEIAALEPVEFFQALKEYEAILEEGLKPYLYASLLFAEDSQNTEYKSLLQKGKEFWNDLENRLLFFSLGLDPPAGIAPARTSWLPPLADLPACPRIFRAFPLFHLTREGRGDHQSQEYDRPVGIYDPLR